MSLATSVDELLTNANNLPTLPGIAVRLLEAFQADEPDTNEIAEILDESAGGKLSRGGLHFRFINQCLVSHTTSGPEIHGHPRAQGGEQQAEE